MRVFIQHRLITSMNKRLITEKAGFKKNANKYKQALKEIREIAENIVEKDVYENSDIKAQSILNKINEVLNERN